MSISWAWPGSRWWRVDLHAHSPASYDYRPDVDRDAKDWTAWLAGAKAAGLDAIAVTDHNTAHGIDAIRQAAAAGTGFPVVLPGAEITANDGTHLLLILDPACSQQHVDEVLSRANIPVDQRGVQTARSPLSVEQLLGLEGYRGIILGAHVNAAGGLLEHDGQQRIAVLKNTRLAGVEVDPTQPLDASWLDGSRPEIARRIPQFWASDSHEQAKAGRRFTWVKMTRPDAEGLRLAFLDGPDSLRLAETTSPGDPNLHGDHVIEGIVVREAKYMGRVQPLAVSLNPWLNALIGGRGTGKSTIVDLCRLTLRREGELGGGGETSLRAAFDKRMRVPAGRTEEGLLTDATVVEITYRKDGERFRLSWDRHGRTSPAVRLVNGQAIPEQGDVRERFPVRIYSQKQLFDLAREPNALLSVIDDSPQVRGAELARLRKEAETEYLSLCADARSLRAQMSDLSARRATLTDVKRKLEVLQHGGHAQTLSEYRIRTQQNDGWESIQKAAVETLDVVARAAEPPSNGTLGLGPDAVGEMPTSLRLAQERLRTVVEDFRAGIATTIAQARTGIADVQTSEEAVAWRAEVSASEREYQAVTQKLTEAGIANPDEYRDLLQRSIDLEKEIATLEKRSITVEAREQEAATSLGRYRALRGELTKRRKEFAAEASGDLVKVDIREYAVQEGLEDFLRDALGIPRFDGDYEKLVLQIAPPGGGPWTFERLDERVSRLREMLDDPSKQWDTTDRRFETALRKLQPERLDRLALHLPDDAVDVSFRDSRENTAWRKLAQGSPGQQTAALLAFVLGYGHEPIILDQPEDDLDNTLIYELLVRRLRERKLTRQVIVVTHNPNIVVHGDAELVVSLGVHGGQTQLVFAGGLQETKARDEVCRVMEGGRDAFETRYRRIMLPSGR